MKTNSKINTLVNLWLFVGKFTLKVQKDSFANYVQSVELGIIAMYVGRK